MNVTYLTVEQVLALHHEIMLDESQQAVLVDAGKLDAAVFRPGAEAFGEELFPTLAEKAAALLQAIVIAHPFLDGNKRAGSGAMLMFLALNGVSHEADQERLYDLVIAVASGEMREVDQVAAQLRKLFPGLD